MNHIVIMMNIFQKNQNVKKKKDNEGSNYYSCKDKKNKKKNYQ